MNRSNFLLKFLWGKEYINGIWTYSYELNGERRFGVWRIAQDVYGVSITGYGLDKHKKIRSTSKSITPLFNNQGLYEMTFLRTVVTAPDRQHIAKTTFYLDNFKRGKLHSAPKVMRAQSIIFGGPEGGTSHVDVLARKQDGAETEEEAVARIDVRKA